MCIYIEESKINNNKESKTKAPPAPVKPKPN